MNAAVVLVQSPSMVFVNSSFNTDIEAIILSELCSVPMSHHHFTPLPTGSSHNKALLFAVVLPL